MSLSLYEDFVDGILTPYPIFDKRTHFGLDLLDHADRLARSLDHWIHQMDDQYYYPRFRTRARRDIPLDIVEQEKEYVIKADVHGYTKENLDVEVNENNVLSIRLKHDQEKSEESHKGTRSIRISRNFVLPQNVNASTIEAKLDKGLLQITIPKHSTPGKTRIEII